MRILHVLKKRKLSGQALRVCRVLAGLKARGHEVALACRPESAMCEWAEREGILIHRLPMLGLRLFRSVPRLRRVIRRGGYQVVHAHGARDHLLCALALVGVPGVALLRTKHDVTPLHSGPFSRLLYVRRTTRLVAISQGVREALIRDGVPASKMDLVFTGIDTSRFSPRPKDPAVRERLGLPQEALVVGLVARLGSKSVDTMTLLRAFRGVAPRYPQARLLLVGRGDRAAAIQAEGLGLTDRVVLPGFVRDVPAMLSEMDLYVQPNVRAALGSAVIEAMAMAKPVLATRTGGHPEVVVDGETGRLCPAGDPDAMAEAITGLMELPREQLDAMGQKGRQRAEELFDQEKMIAQTEAVYERVAASPSHATA